MNTHNDEQLMRDTTSRMAAYVSKYITPISVELEPGYGRLLGSGSYLKLDDRIFVVTNEHVCFEAGEHQAGHLLIGSDDYYRFQRPAIGIRDRRDVAVSVVNRSAWLMNSSLAITQPMLADSHSPIAKELLFFMGYPGDRSRFSLDTLVTRAQPYLTQEDVSMAYDETTFFLPYNTEYAQRVDGGTQPLPLANGLSGSLVWNTRRIEFSNRGDAWQPSDARVTGILQRWVTGDVCLRATRIEEMKLRWLVAQDAR